MVSEACSPQPVPEEFNDLCRASKLCERCVGALQPGVTSEVSEEPLLLSVEAGCQLWTNNHEEWSSPLALMTPENNSITRKETTRFVIEYDDSKANRALGLEARSGPWNETSGKPWSAGYIRFTLMVVNPLLHMLKEDCMIP